MICKNCSTEVSEDSKFCSECGKEIIKERSELRDLVFTAQKVYFMLGFINGQVKMKKKEPLWFTNFIESMKKVDKSLYEEYEEVKGYWKNLANSTSKKK